MTDGPLSITVSRLFRHRRERVFRAFSVAQKMAQWFTPHKDIRVQVLALQFEPQGAFRFRWDNPDGSHTIVGGRFQHISPPEELVFTWLWESPDPHAGVLTHVVVQFLDRDGHTEVVIKHSRLPSEASCARHKEGWDGALASLEGWLPVND